MPKATAKKTIAVDIDDVLAANAEGFVEFSNKRWGTKLEPGDYTEHWAELWRVDAEEVARRRDILLEEKVFLNHRFFDEAKPVLKELARKYNLVIVSSRNRFVQAETIDWIKKEYGGLFSGVYFADMWDRQNLKLEERLKETKNDVLKRIKADYLIDDQPKHCLAAAESGITALMFGDYKWNRDVVSVPGVIRAATWEEILNYFDGQS